MCFLFVLWCVELELFVYGKHSVSSCRCNVCAFCGSSQLCMTCRLLMMDEDARGDHVEEAQSRACFMTAL